jgi:hypothetical protein
MLLEIESDAFRVPKVVFHGGLNVVIGDPGAANSIGKSSFLMVVDFVFGGNSLVELNDDIVRNVGDHEFRFAFEFSGNKFHFKRETSQHAVIVVCDPQYTRLRDIGIAEYTGWLLQAYAPDLKNLSFRSMVGTYSRVWPKDNVTNVHRPLHAFASQSASECVDTLIKLFGRFGQVEQASAKFKSIEDQRKVWRKAEGMAFVPKIGKKQYIENEAVLNLINEEVADIKSDLAQYTLNLRAIVDREVLELAQDKDMLLREKSKITQRLVRTQQNIGENKHIKSSQLDALRQFFPEVNVNKLAEIEEFHSAVARLLKKELMQTERNLSSELAILDLAIARIDAQVAERLSEYSEPNVIVDRVYRLSEKWTALKSANRNFEKRTALDKDFSDAKLELGSVKTAILSELQQLINTRLAEFVAEIYGPGGTAPHLTLGENSYQYEIADDTGTGTAFANLVLFDLTILSLTELPFLIHDLPLFKNVENEAVAAFAVEYTKFPEKQIFTVLDEIDKYGKTTVEILRKRCVLELTEQDVLYKRKWRSR